MIYCYCGSIGGGKTLLAVDAMLERIANGGIVYSNVELHKAECMAFIKEKWKKVPDWDLAYHRFTADSVLGVLNTLKAAPRGRPNTMLVIDECVEYFDASDREGNEGKQIHRTWGRFLRQSRKVRIDVVLIAQRFESINAKMRGLIQRKVITRDCEKWSLVFMPLGRWIPFLRNRHRQVFFDLESKTDVGAKWWRKDSRLWKCYDTEQIFGGSLAVASGVDAAPDIADVDKPKSSIGIAVVCLACIGLGLFLGSCFGGKTKVVETVQIVERQSPAFAVAPVSAVPHFEPVAAPVNVVITNIYDVGVPEWIEVDDKRGRSICIGGRRGLRYDFGKDDSPWGKLYSIGENVCWFVSYWPLGGGTTEVCHVRLLKGYSD